MIGSKKYYQFLILMAHLDNSKSINFLFAPLLTVTFFSAWRKWSFML